jgi:hypothetical protein
MEIQLRRITRGSIAAALVAACLAPQAALAQTPPAWAPGGRVLLDAHNCYPYDGKWADRITRALSTGTPLAIEQDLVWYTDPKTGAPRSVVSHGRPMTGNEPSLEEYFFGPVAPLLRNALAKGNDGSWPIVTLNIDFKDSSPEHSRAVWDVLKKYEDLTTTAVKTSSIAEVSTLDVKPLLVLASGAGGQFQVFYNDVPAGAKLLLFGAAETSESPPAELSGEDRARYVAAAPPEKLVTKAADNFRRWWNNSWFVVEAGGAPQAGDWTPEDAARLTALVDHAHAMGYWIRFYTLNGHTPEESLGWDRSYNVGSREAVAERWRAEISTGVDFVATDMYEAFASTKKLALGEGRNDP